MFNSYEHHNHNEIKINSCSGGIYKTYKESWFEYVNLAGNISNILFKRTKSDDYRNNRLYQKYDETVVLQMILTSEPEFVIAELIKEEDFKKYFENKGEE